MQPDPCGAPTRTQSDADREQIIEESEGIVGTIRDRGKSLEGPLAWPLRKVLEMEGVSESTLDAMSDPVELASTLISLVLSGGTFKAVAATAKGANQAKEAGEALADAAQLVRNAGRAEKAMKIGGNVISDAAMEAATEAFQEYVRDSRGDLLGAAKQGALVALAFQMTGAAGGGVKRAGGKVINWAMNAPGGQAVGNTLGALDAAAQVGTELEPVMIQDRDGRPASSLASAGGDSPGGADTDAPGGTELDSASQTGKDSGDESGGETESGPGRDGQAGERYRSRPFPELEPIRSQLGPRDTVTRNHPGAGKAFLRALQKAALERGRRFGVSAVVETDQVLGAQARLDGKGGILIELNNDLLGKVIDGHDGKANKIAQTLERIVQEELIHAAYLSNLLDEWRASGNGKDIESFLFDRSAREFIDLRKALKRIPEADARRITEGLKASANLYSKAKETMAGRDSPAEILDHIQSLSPLEQYKILGESVRAFIQDRNTGRLSETQILSSKFFEVVVDTVRRLLRRIRTAAKLLREQGSEFPIQRLIEPTEKILRDAEAFLRGEVVASTKDSDSKVTGGMGSKTGPLNAGSVVLQSPKSENASGETDLDTESPNLSLSSSGFEAIRENGIPSESGADEGASRTALGESNNDRSANEKRTDSPIRGKDWFERIAREGTRSADSDKMVLGHAPRKGEDFPREHVTYERVAAHYGATYLKVENWRDLSQKLTREEQWEINEAFLIQQVSQGKQILFSHDPLEPKPDSFFQREVNWLLAYGYQFRRINNWTWEAFL